MFQLRDYQQELLDNIRCSMINGNKSIVVQSPPRSGKTVVMSEIAKNATQKCNTVIFCVHRREILAQVRASFESNGVDMSLVILETPQTLVRRLNKTRPPDIFLVDEAHRIKGKTYMKLLEAFDASYKLFFTGTPTRLDGKGFEDVADDIILGKSVKWLQDNGNISKFRYFSNNLIDTSKLKKSMGEYTNGSIDDALDNKIHGDVIKHYQKLADGMQAIVYVHSVAMANEVASEFNKHGYTAEAVSGKTSPKIRDATVDKFRNKELQILVNVELFTEGIDLPDVDVCIMLRPTASLALYLQFAMRPLNPREGKTAILIDHVGNVHKHGLPNAERGWSLAGKSKKNRKQENEISITECPECYSAFDPSECEKIKTEDGYTVKKCPYCEYLIERKRAELVKVEADLTEIDQLILSDNAPETLDQCEKPIDFLALAQKSGYKPMWAVYKMHSQGLLKSVEDLKTIGAILNYKPGWAYYQAKKMKLM